MMELSAQSPVRTLFSPSGELRRLGILALGSAILFAAGIGMRSLWNPNEPVYGEAVREMLARGEYHVPVVNGRVYSDKPIFYFWTMLAACAAGGGLSEAALRVPSVAAGVLSVLAVYVLGRFLFGIRAGFLAAASLATMGMFWWHSQYVQMDQLLSFLILAALACFVLAKESPGPRSLLLAGASGAMMGLAFLTKGPVGLVVPAAILGIYLLATREIRWMFSRDALVMTCLFVVVAAPWYLSLAFTGHDQFLVDFFIRHNYQRATDPFNHQQPFYYYIPRLLSDLFPWSLLIPAAWFASAGSERERRGRLFVRIWFAAVLILFSAAGAKRGVYLLPLYPAAALLVGTLFEELIARENVRPRLRRGAAIGLVAVAAVLVALTAASVFVNLRGTPYLREARLLIPVGLVTAVGAVLLALALRRGRTLRAFTVTACTMAALFLYSDLALLPAAERYKSPVPFCQRLQQEVGPADEIRSFGLWRWDSSYIYYTRRLMPQLKSREELHDYLAQDRKVFLLAESSDLERFVSELGVPVRVIARQEIGHKTTALLVNGAGGT
jgi:4-amino-4-deoxy-L-arabinose transferase-like glycosyltransferase